MKTKRLYAYNFDVYLGYLDLIAPYALVFTREDTTNCWRAATAIEQFGLENENCGLYSVLVKCRTFDEEYAGMFDVLSDCNIDGYNEWLVWVHNHGRFINDTFWVSETKVDGSDFWNFPQAEFMYRKDYIKGQKTILNF